MGSDKDPIEMEQRKKKISGTNDGLDAKSIFLAAETDLLLRSRLVKSGGGKERGATSVL